MNTNAYALIVGIAAYKFINKLPRSVINDAGAIHGILTDPNGGGYLPNNVELLTDYQADQQSIRTALEKLAQKVKDDNTVFIYFSGHGAQLDTPPHRGEYLLPVEADFSSAQALAETAISGDDFTTYMRAIPTRRLIIIFDCCHSGGIGTLKSPTTFDIKQGLPEAYFEKLQTGRGRVIIASSRSSEFSYILPGAQNSLFTQCLLEGLQGGAPGVGGVIRIFDLFNYLQPKVTAAQSNQHPIFRAELEENFPMALYMGGKSPELIPLASPSDNFEFDVFISYERNGSNKSWVKELLVPTLEANGIRVCIDYNKCFSLGIPYLTAMERAVMKSRYTLAVLTPAYLKSSFAEFENVMATHLGLEQSERRFMAVLREDCKPSLNIRARMWLDMTREEEFTQNVERLVYVLKQSSNL